MFKEFFFTIELRNLNDSYRNLYFQKLPGMKRYCKNFMKWIVKYNDRLLIIPFFNKIITMTNVENF